MCALLANRINRVPKKSFAVLTEETHRDETSAFSNLSKSNSLYHQNCIVPDENYNIRLYSIGGKIQPHSQPPPPLHPQPPPPPPPLIQKLYTPSKEFFNRVSAKLKALHSTKTENPAIETKKEQRMDKPMFITTVRKGTFLEPPPEVAVLLGLRKNNFDEKSVEDASNNRRKNLLYLFSSKPRIVKSSLHGITSPAPDALTERQNRRHKREIKSTNENTEGSIHYGNTMYDRRVARGSNFASTRATNPVLVEPLLNRQAEARRRAAVRQRAQIRARKLRMRTPPPVDGRKHEQMQTDRHYLEELTERPPENSIACQAALPFDDTSATSTLELNHKNTGVDVETQINPGDLPEYDDETYSVAIASIVKNILQEAILEINDEIQNNYRNIFINESKVTKTTNSNEIQIDENAVIITKDEIRTLINGVIPNLMNLASSKIQQEIENSDVFVFKILNEIRTVIKNENFVSDIIKTQLQNWSSVNSRSSSVEKHDENSTNDSDGEQIRPASLIKTDSDDPGNTEIIPDSSLTDQTEISSTNDRREQGEQNETDFKNQNAETNVLEQKIANELTTTIEHSENPKVEQNDENEISIEEQTIQQDSSALEHNSENAEQPKNTDSVDTNLEGKLRIQRSLTEKSEVKSKSVVRKAVSEETKSNTTRSELSTETSKKEDQKQPENVINDGNGSKIELTDSTESVRVEEGENKFTINNKVEVEGLSEQQNEKKGEIIPRNFNEEPEEKLNDSSNEILVLEENKDNTRIEHGLDDGTERNTQLTENQTENPDVEEIQNAELNAKSVAAQIEESKQNNPSDLILTEIPDKKLNEAESLRKMDNTPTPKSKDEIHELNEQTAPNANNDNDTNSKENSETKNVSSFQEISETSEQPQKLTQNDLTTQSSIFDANNEAPTRVQSNSQENDHQEGIKEDANKMDTEKILSTAESQNEQNNESNGNQENTTENENEINQNETFSNSNQNQSNNLVQNDTTTTAPATQTNNNNLQISSQSNGEHSGGQSLISSSTTTNTISSTSETKNTKVDLIESRIENEMENKQIDQNETNNESMVNETDKENKADSITNIDHVLQSDKPSQPREEFSDTIIVENTNGEAHRKFETESNSNTNISISTETNFQNNMISYDDHDRELNKAHSPTLENKTADTTQLQDKTNNAMESDANVKENEEPDQKIISSENEPDLNKPAKIPNGKLATS